MTGSTESASLSDRSREDLEAEVTRLEEAAVPLQAEVARLRVEVEVLRTELRRRDRQQRLQGRQMVRADLASGKMPSLEGAVSGAEVDLGGVAFDDLRFVRESATEVRLGYASSSRQSLSFTDGGATEDVYDLGAARELWQRGWEFGTPTTRGVRIYPTGSRAERVVPAAEIHVELKQ